MDDFTVGVVVPAYVALGRARGRTLGKRMSVLNDAYSDDFPAFIFSSESCIQSEPRKTNQTIPICCWSGYPSVRRPLCHVPWCTLFGYGDLSGVFHLIRSPLSLSRSSSLLYSSLLTTGQNRSELAGWLADWLPERMNE